MSQNATPAGVIAAGSPQIDGVGLLDDPARLYLARRAIETEQGTPLEVARLLGLDAATVCALLGVEAD